MADVFRNYPGISYGGSPSTFLPYGSAGEAQQFNLQGGANTSQISDLINSITRGAQGAALQARIPGEANLETQSSANIQSELEGQLPADVMRTLGQQAAERGVATGSPGSPNTNAAYLRALGLTSLDLTGMGQSQLTAAEGRNPAAPIFDPSSQLITPYQGATLGAEQTRLAQSYDLERERLAMERANLARQAAFGGGQGRSGTATPEPGLQYVQGPWASDVGNPPAVYGPGGGPTSTGTYGYNPQIPTYGQVAQSPEDIFNITSDQAMAGIDVP
jgi:hypothetical protein